MRATPLAVVLLVSLGACRGPEPALPSAARPSPSRTAAPVPPEPRDAPEKSESADVVVAEALAHVARLRELAPKGPVRGRTISRAEMVDRIKKQLEKEVPEPVIRAQTELLFALGTVPADFDYEKSLLELMGDQLAGFYQPDDKTMYLGADLGGMERDATLAHELVHALQDQYYDLGKLLEYRTDANDLQSAIHALAEGDATSAMLDHMLVPRGQSALSLSDELVSVEVRGSIEMSPGSAGVPSILKRSVVAPYVDGIALVHWARRRGGWAAVDAVWRSPPATTEQLLHPEKMLAHEVGEAIPVPLAPPNGPAKDIYHDIMGEESNRILFEEWMGRRVAIDAASGWAGDRVVMFEDGDRYALGWHLRWDDEAGAARGAEAFARGVLRAPDTKAEELVAGTSAARAMRGGSACRLRPKSGPFAVLRKHREVVLVSGPYVRTNGTPESAASCAQALKWAAAIADQK
jgi:hypothetical protein